MSDGHFEINLPILSAANLRHAGKGVILPAYDRSRMQPGIIHLGLGNFQRAHQAIFLDRIIAKGDPRWGAVGLSLRRPDVRNDLAPQDYLYAVHYDDGRDRELRVVGCLRDMIVTGEEASRLADLVTCGSVKIVTLTVTEKGYCRANQANDLDFDHPDVRHDLTQDGVPKSAIGLVCWMIALRWRNGMALPSFMSCDNLPSNGKALRRLVGQFLAERYPDLAECAADEGLFPCSMVDRIVPEITPESRRKICRMLGLNDAMPIDTEPFIQWVIEDRSSGERPDWAQAGVTITSDVHLYEMAKLRLLNGSHSAIAYLGLLCGYGSVSDAMADADLSAFITRLQGELIPTVPETPGLDLGDYARRLCARFRNPRLLHKTTQIAMDGSQKLPQRLLDPIRARLRRSEPFACMAMAVAGWIRYATGVDEKDTSYEVRDPLVARLRALSAARSDPEQLASTALDIHEVFGADLPRDERFRRSVVDALRLLMTRGAKASFSVTR